MLLGTVTHLSRPYRSEAQAKEIMTLYIVVPSFI